MNDEHVSSKNMFLLFAIHETSAGKHHVLNHVLPTVCGIIHICSLSIHKIVAYVEEHAKKLMLVSCNGT
jgi:hypothetical protein